MASSFRSSTNDKNNNNNVAITSLPTLNFPDGTAMTLDEISNRLRGKHVAYYFAAGWCPMCTSLEPNLFKFREQQQKDIELIYVPSDRSISEVVTRTKILNMLSVPYGEEADTIKKRYKIWAGMESTKLGTGRRSGVPALVVLNGTNGEEMTFLPTESQGAQALQLWNLKDADGLWW